MADSSMTISANIPQSKQLNKAMWAKQPASAVQTSQTTRPSTSSTKAPQPLPGAFVIPTTRRQFALPAASTPAVPQTTLRDIKQPGSASPEQPKETPYDAMSIIPEATEPPTSTPPTSRSRIAKGQSVDTPLHEMQADQAVKHRPREQSSSRSIVNQLRTDATDRRRSPHKSASLSPAGSQHTLGKRKKQSTTKKATAVLGIKPAKRLKANPLEAMLRRSQENVTQSIMATHNAEGMQVDFSRETVPSQEAAKAVKRQRPTPLPKDRLHTIADEPAQRPQERAGVPVAPVATTRPAHERQGCVVFHRVATSH